MSLESKQEGWGGAGGAGCKQGGYEYIQPLPATPLFSLSIYASPPCQQRQMNKQTNKHIKGWIHIQIYVYTVMYHMSAYLPSQAWPHSGLWHLGKGSLRECWTGGDATRRKRNWNTIQTAKESPKSIKSVVGAGFCNFFAIWTQILWKPGSIWCKSGQQQSLKRTSEEAKALCQLWIVGGGETIAASLCPTCDPPPPPQPTSSSRASSITFTINTFRNDKTSFSDTWHHLQNHAVWNLELEVSIDHCLGEYVEKT